MSGMTGGIAAVLLVVWAIALFVLYHKVFTVLYFDLARGIGKEIMYCLIGSVIMTGLTIYFYWIVAIVVVIAGIVLSLKISDNTKRIYLIVASVVLALVVFFIGRNAKNELMGDEKSNTKEDKNVIMTQDGYNFDDWYNDNYKGKKQVYFKLTVPMDNGTHLSEKSTVLVVFPYLSGYDLNCRICMKEEYVTNWDWVDYDWVAKDEEPRTMLCVATFKENTKDIPGEAAYFNISDVKVLATYDEAYVNFDTSFNPISWNSNQTDYDSSDDGYYNDYSSDSSYADSGYYEEDTNDENYYDEQYDAESESSDNDYSEEYEDEANSFVYAIDGEESTDFWTLYENDIFNRELTESDLYSFTAKELTYLRNNVYAKHGYVFNSQELNDYYSQYADYVQNPDFAVGELSAVEKYNVDFIKDYQNANGLTYSPQ